MPLAAVITIIGAALTVLVLAAYLISIVLVLWRVNARLRSVVVGLQVVNERTEPIGSIVGGINSDLSRVDDALRGVLGRR